MTSWPLTSRRGRAWSRRGSRLRSATSPSTWSQGDRLGPNLFPHDDATWAPPGARARGV